MEGLIVVKELSKMTLEELWRLFPIILKDYNTDYVKWYDEERERLTNTFRDIILRINHIGSTAIPNIISKPIVDILMEVSKDSDKIKIANKLKSMGWLLMNCTEEPYFKQTYNKGYTKYGFDEKVYHLHIRYADDWDELYFRDYLIEHNDIAKKYEKIKKELKGKFEYNRDAYTLAKGEFVNKYSAIAKDEYCGRYKYEE